MTDAGKLVRAGGVMLAIAGILYIAVPFVPSWRALDQIGTTNWWTASYLSTLHHFVVLFGLFAPFTVQREQAGWLGLLAFVTATLGNALAGAIGVVRIAVLPVMASNPDGQAALVCLPFYDAATEAARAFIAAACESWNFDVLGVLAGSAWFALIFGSIALGLAILRAKVLRPGSGVLLVVGWLGILAGVVLPIPEFITDFAYGVVGVAYLWCGIDVWSAERP